MKTAVTFVLAVSVFVLPASAGAIDFVRENIYITMHLPDTMCVMGEYFFCAKDHGAVNTSVLYPFPVDSAIEYPHTIRVFYRKNSLAYHPFSDTTVVVVPVSIDKGDTAEITIIYRQRLRKSTGRYILTTTQSWDKPLCRSNYYVTVPPAIVLTKLSYQTDSVFTKKDSLVYYFTRDGFMPSQDIVFLYKKR